MKQSINQSISRIPTLPKIWSNFRRCSSKLCYDYQFAWEI